MTMRVPDSEHLYQEVKKINNIVLGLDKKKKWQCYMYSYAALCKSLQFVQF